MIKKELKKILKQYKSRGLYLDDAVDNIIELLKKSHNSEYAKLENNELKKKLEQAEKEIKKYKLRFRECYANERGITTTELKCDKLKKENEEITDIFKALIYYRCFPCRKKECSITECLKQIKDIANE